MKSINRNNAWLSVSTLVFTIVTLSSVSAWAGSTMVTDAAGTQTLWTFTQNLGVNNLVSKLNQSDGKGITQQFDANNNLIERVDADGRKTTYTYNASNQKDAMTEAAGTELARTTTYNYVSPDIDLVSKKTEASVAPGLFKETLTLYDANLNVSSITINGFDALSAPVSRTMSFSYNATSQVTQVDGPRSDISDISTVAYYSCTTGGQCGQTQSTSNAKGHTISYDQYDANGRLLQQTDAKGTVSTFVYHPRGWLLSQTRTASNNETKVTSNEYDNIGQLIKTTLPDGTEQNFVYDSAHDLREISDNLGNKIEYTYDTRGNRTHELIEDPDGTLVRSNITVFDIRNHVQSINNGGSITQLVNDAVGNVSVLTDPNVNPTTDSSYDALNRLDSILDALSNTTGYQYDVADQLVQVNAPNGATTDYQYDDLGNLLKEISADRGTIVYTHDAAGNVLTRTDARGITASYQYDALNRITGIDYPDTDDDVAYTYDSFVTNSQENCSYGVGLLCYVTDQSGSTHYEYDPFGNVTKQTTIVSASGDETEDTYITEYTYDSAYRVVSMRYPSGMQVDYLRDILGRISTVTADTATNGSATPNTEILVTNRMYRADGLLLTQEFGNGVIETRSYDLRGQLESVDFGQLDSVVYTHDGNGNIETLDTNSKSSGYTYDSLNRIKTDLLNESGNTIFDKAYEYDLNGNRELFTEDGISAANVYAPLSNRIDTVDGNVIQLDASGNTLSDVYTSGSFTYNRTMVYDAAGRVQSSQLSNGLPATAYRYNSQNQRVRKLATKPLIEENTVYNYDLNGNMISESSVYLYGFSSTALKEQGSEYVWANNELIAYMEPIESIVIESTPPASGNLAQYKSAEQSSTVNGRGAEEAVDGGTYGNGEQTATLTESGQVGQESWWEVDLGVPVAIDQIRVWERTDSGAGLVNAQVMVSNVPFTSPSVQENIDSADWSYLIGSVNHAIYINATVTGRYVRIQKTNTYPLRLAEVQVVGTAQGGYGNIALEKSSSQSSTMFRRGPWRAVDGNSLGYYYTSADSQSESNPWWEVDLGDLSQVEQVILYEHYSSWESLNDAYVMVSQDPFQSSDLQTSLSQPGVWSTHIDAVPYVEAVQVGVLGRYVRIQRNTTTDLTLSEVQVIGGTVPVVLGSQPSMQSPTDNLVAAIADSFIAVAVAATAPPETAKYIYYAHVDHMGTPRLLTDEAGAKVWEWWGDAFGNSTPYDVVGGLNLRFPGQYYDEESGLFYNWNRYYDPKTGRYITSDPVGLRGGINTFGYVGGNPLMYVDPQGLRGSYCQRPLGDYSGQNGGGPPLFNHQFVCVTLTDGSVKCDSNNNPDNDTNPFTPAPGEPSRPDRDNESVAECDNIDDDSDRCFEDCVLKQWSQPRPNYAIGPLGTDCQEYSQDIVRTCRAQCP